MDLAGYGDQRSRTSGSRIGEHVFDDDPARRPRSGWSVTPRWDPCVVPNHRQVQLSVGTWTAQVDEGIAEFIEALWRRRIKTLFSCEDVEPWSDRWRVAPGERRVGVTFATADDLLRLLRRLPWGSEVFNSALGDPPRWDYDFLLSRWLPRSARESGIPLSSSLRLQVHTAIPRADLPEL